MGKAIIISIGILFSLTLLSVVSGNEFIGVSDEVDFGTIGFINGTTTTWGEGANTFSLGLDALEGAIVWFIAIIVIISIAGIQVVSSGLSETSVRTIRTGLMYGGIWSILSILTWDLITGIPTFGTIIWISLTIIYAIGVFQKMGDNG